MPRGQKSKLRAREKRHQARGVTQSGDGGQAVVVEEARSPLSSSPLVGGSSQSSPDAHIPWGPPSASSTSTVAADASCPGAAGKAKGQDEASSLSSEASHPTERSQRDPLAYRVSMLLQFLLHKYKLKEPITKGGMMKIINRRYKEHFPEILRRATEHMELAFGLDLKEADSQGQSYVLVSKLEITREEIMRGGRGFPRNGILLPLLGMIYSSGDRVPEEEMWDFLTLLGIHEGKRHFIFGDPRKLITKDLVQEEYLEYRRVPNSDPPRYEFLCGPRARAEATKKMVMDFIDKINNTDSSAFQSLNKKFWEVWMRQSRAVSELVSMLLLPALRHLLGRSFRRPPSPSED